MKSDLKQQIDTFLSKKNIAIVGYAWEGDDPAKHVFSKLKKLDYKVIPVGSDKTSIEGIPCVKSLYDVPKNTEIDAVLVTGSAVLSTEVIEACALRGISLVWLHSALGTSPRPFLRKMEYKISSVGKEPLAAAKKHGISIIPGGCPMMFREPVDLPHKVVKKILDKLGCFEEREF